MAIEQMLPETLYDRAWEVCRYQARSLEELHLKAQILVGLIDGDMPDVCDGLAKSIRDDAEFLSQKYSGGLPNREAMLSEPTP